MKLDPRTGPASYLAASEGAFELPGAELVLGGQQAADAGLFRRDQADGPVIC